MTKDESGGRGSAVRPAAGPLNGQAPGTLRRQAQGNLPRRGQEVPSPLRQVLFDNWLNVLLVFVPVALLLEWLDAPDIWVFVATAVAIAPLAGLIGEGTGQLALHAGPGVGALVNASFGNTAELLISGFAVAAGLPEVVKASLAGSILGNILLVLGGAAFVGGLGRRRQRFSATGASAKNLMLFIAVAGMIMPAVYSLSALGSLNREDILLDDLSLLTSIVLLVAYAAGLIFSLRTHSEVFSETEEQRHHQRPFLSVRAATILLLVVTALTAVMAETLVGSIEGAAHALGLTDLFVGFIVVAVVGNAAENFSAVLFARRNQMQLAINIAKDSSVQIALLVAPLLVVFSFLIGKPMSLVFNPFELFGLGLAVLAVSFASLDGESNWYEGLLLLALYVIVGLASYFAPA